jgi:phosphoribosylanthranilate isomerase
MEAVEAVAPYAIDVSSGVERVFGQKDPDKLRALFTALRAAEHADHAEAGRRRTSDG